MSSSRVVRVRPAEDGAAAAGAARRHRRDPARARGQSGVPARGRRRPPRRRSRTRGCPTSTAPTCRWSPSTRAGAKDLDQALHLARTDDGGYVLHYAIADLAAFITPGDPVDLEAHRRGQTLYGADSRVPLHPTVISEGGGSLLPDQVRPGAAVDDHGWTARARAPTSRSSGRWCAAAPSSTTRASSRQIDDGSADESLMLLKEVGELRLKREAARGGVSLPLPEQEVDTAGDGVGAGVPRPAAGRGVERADVAAHRLRRGVADDVRAGRLPAHPAAAGPARRPAAAPHRARARHRVAGRAALRRLHPRASTRPSRSTPR